MKCLYIIHLDPPLHHAKHYVGATVRIHKRLKLHATGQGAKILAAQAANGGNWVLARLAATTHQFSAEKFVKIQKNACTYCPICSPDAARQIPDSIDYPVELVTPRTLKEIQNEQEKKRIQSAVGRTSRPETN